MAKLVATETAQQVIDSRRAVARRSRRRGRRAGRAALSRDSRAAHLRRDERDSEDRDRRAGLVVTVAPDRARRHVRARPSAAARSVARRRTGPACRSCRIRDRFNAAAPLLDDWIARGHGDRPALASRRRHLDVPASVRNRQSHRARAGRRSAASCRAAACCCGRPTSRCSSRAGSRVIKAGGVAVTTMPLLRVRELGDIIDTGAGQARDHRRVGGRGSRARAGRPPGRAHRSDSTSAAGDLEALMATSPPTFENVQTAGATIRRSSRSRPARPAAARAPSTPIAICWPSPTPTGATCSRPTADDIFIGSPPHRVHVRARRARAVSDAIRRVHRAHRAGVAAAAARGHSAVPRDDRGHVADGVSRDAEADRRLRSDEPAQVRVGRRNAAGGDVRRVANRRPASD